MSLNVIIPLAGNGSRFKKSFFKRPKPLIKVFNKTLIEIAINSLNLKKPNFFFIIKKYKNNKFNKELLNILIKYTKRKQIIKLRKTTSGPVSSCLKIKKINKNKPLIIANCDQYLNWNPNLFFDFVKKNNAQGAVLSYNSSDKKNSFVSVKNGEVVNIVEKKVVSNHALIGIHYWKKTKYFFETGRQLIKEIEETQSKKEPYISETYNYMLKKRLIVKTYPLKKSEYFLIGTPKDYYNFKKFINKNDKRYFF
jgi:NDP-sugar pyrophosphorylase family protein